MGCLEGVILMPKVYTSARERQRAYISRLFKAKRDFLGVNNEQIGDVLGLTDRAVRYKINKADFDLVDLYELRHLMPFSMEELQLMIGGQK